MNETVTKALRYNEGKPDWTLLDYPSLLPLVDVMTYGASKYTTKSPLNVLSLFQLLKHEICRKLEPVLVVERMEIFSQKEDALRVIQEILEKNLNAANVEKSDLLRLEVCAALAMKKNESQIYQKPNKEFLNIKENTENGMITKSENTQEIREEGLIHTISKLKEDGNFSIDYQNMDSQKLHTMNTVLEAVQSVGASSDYILIMTMNQENSEVYYVENATKELDCLMKTFQFCKKLFNISQFINNENEIVNSGRDNWKLPTDNKLEPLQSAMRHLIALISGEEFDKESGMRHTGHIMANMMFYNFRNPLNKE